MVIATKIPITLSEGLPDRVACRSADNLGRLYGSSGEVAELTLDVCTQTCPVLGLEGAQPGYALFERRAFDLSISCQLLSAGLGIRQDPGRSGVTLSNQSIALFNALTNVLLVQTTRQLKHVI
jgi:hypothetical protein